MTIDITTAAAAIRLLVLDVDGVMTDGKIYVDPTQESLKAYHVQDGLGIKWLQRCGIVVAIITGKESDMVTVRAKTLGIQYVYQNQSNKLPALQSLLTTLDLTESQVAYIGDDIPDLAPISRVGFSVAVANAHPLIKQYAHFTTQASGGNGAIREVAELLLSAQGKLEQIVAQYLNEGGLSHV